MKLRLLIAFLFALVPLAFVASAALPQGKDPAALMADLRKARDEADPKLVQELAKVQDEAALTGLIECFDSLFNSVYMKREVVKALASFDGVTALQDKALGKLTDISTTSQDLELRAAAIDALGDCVTRGKHYLRSIVNSLADGQVRERAMQKIVARPSAEDHDFFAALFNAFQEEKGKDDKDKKKSKKDEEAPKKPYPLKLIRELAFQQIAQDEKLFPLERLAELTKERDDTGATTDWERTAGIRRLALLELERRKAPLLAELAKQMYDSPVERGVNRAEALRIRAEKEGDKIIPLLMEDGRASGSGDYEVLRMAQADLLAKLRDDETTKKLVKLVGKGNEAQQRFVLRALRGHSDAGMIKSLLKDVVAAAKKKVGGAKDPNVDLQRNLTLQILETIGASGEKSAVADLTEALGEGKDTIVLGAMLDAIGKLRGQESAWVADLVNYAKDPRLELRNAALSQLGALKDPKHAPVFVAALESEHWETRLAALDALAALRSKEAVGAIVARMEKEYGLTLQRFAEALWRMTGKPFRTQPAAWKAWWDKEGADFQPISAAALAKLEEEEEMRRLKQTTKATFFGIRIVSHRVIFIIDVSGSMAWEVNTEKDAKSGGARIDVAKSELTRCIDVLEPNSLFNIITFSGDVDRWLDTGVAEYGKKTKDEAKAFVSALKPGGGTNIYGALKSAFEDPDVDTIFFLSDGEPSVGDETDQYVIRERAKEWNEHRGIVIHTIAVGGNYQILEWLALDSGGTHRKFQ